MSVQTLPRMDIHPVTVDDVYATIYSVDDNILVLIRGNETPFVFEDIEALDVGDPVKTHYQDGISFCFYKCTSVRVQANSGRVGK